MTKRKEDPKYLVHCGDATFYFQFGRLYSLSYLKQVFKRTVNRRLFDDIDLFPGLILRDGSGKLWKPEVQVKLVPVKEPEKPNDTD